MADIHETQGVLFLKEAGRTFHSTTAVRRTGQVVVLREKACSRDIILSHSFYQGYFLIMIFEVI